MAYTVELFSQALQATWELFVDTPISTIIAILFCTAIGIWWDEGRKWRSILTKHALTHLRTIRWPIYGGCVVFIFQLLFITPKKMWESKVHDVNLYSNSLVSVHLENEKLKNTKPQPIPVNVTVSQPASGMSPADQAAFYDFQEVYRSVTFWGSSEIIRLKELQMSSTNEAVKQFEDGRIKEVLSSVETNAAQTMAEIRKSVKFDRSFTNELDGILSYCSQRAGRMLNKKISLNDDQTNEMVAYYMEQISCHYPPIAGPEDFIWFSLIREKTGIKFEMYDYDAVKEWMKKHPSTLKPNTPAPNTTTKPWVKTGGAI